MWLKAAIYGLVTWLVIGAGATGLAQKPMRTGEARPRIRQGTLQDGDPAPEFELKDVAGKNAVQLGNLRGQPVVLIFGSCTCPPFVASTRTVEKLHAAYKDRVHFFIVYVREAHPTDGWALKTNEFQVMSPKSLAEREAIATDFAKRLDITIPVLVDSIDDRVEKSYSGWPNRMYIIDAEGKIAAKGTAGPRGVAGSATTAADVLDRLLEGSK